MASKSERSPHPRFPVGRRLSPQSREVNVLRVAAVTMVWNEAHFLPVWLRHYGRQVGLENCFVIDHGSTDGSISASTAYSVIGIPRSPLDEDRRCAMVSKFCNALLESYDVVIHSDVDELLVADPDIATSLPALASLYDSPVLTAVGLNVVQDPEREFDIDPTKIVSIQRGSAWFVAVMCKPMMIRRPVRWAPGFHSCNARIRFAPMYNFHLRYYDVNQGLTRLTKTRNMERASAGINAHQAIPDDQWLSDFKYGVGTYPILDNITLKLDQNPLQDHLLKIENQQYSRRNESYRLDLDFMETNRWKIPARFVGAF